MKNIFLLSTLYFVQGLPFGLQDKFIPIFLRTSGTSFTGLSLVKLVWITWLCKPVFALVIDFSLSKKLWIFINLVLLVIASLAGAIITPDQFTLFLLWLLIMNFFSAMQDVSVDGMAISVLKECELGHGNSAQVVGFKLGALFGGGALFYVHLYYGWYSLCLSLASLFFISAVAFYYTCSPIDSSFNRSSVPEKHKSPVPESSFDWQNYVSRFKQLFKSKETTQAVIFLLVYKLGEKGASSSFPIYLLDRGIPASSINVWSGICAQLSSTFGSFLSGWIISKRCNLFHFLNVIQLARALLIFSQWLIIVFWHEEVSEIFQSVLFVFSIGSICTLEFFAGMVTTAVFTYMMLCAKKTHPNLQATHYSLLATVEIAGKLFFSSFSGMLIDGLGLGSIYFLFFALSFASIMIWRLVKVPLAIE